MTESNQIPIEELKLHTSPYGILKRNRLDYIDQLIGMKYEDYLNLPQCGPVKANQIMDALYKFTNQKVNEYTRIERIIKELKEIVQRESKRHMMDTHLDSTLHDLIAYEIIPVLEEQIDYEPTDEELGYGSEPPMTMDEMHTTAWKEHQEAHA
jgi:hypothetical protein